jgi:hypothetical protein
MHRLFSICWGFFVTVSCKELLLCFFSLQLNSYYKRVEKAAARRFEVRRAAAAAGGNKRGGG